MIHLPLIFVYIRFNSLCIRFLSFFNKKSFAHFALFAFSHYIIFIKSVLFFILFNGFCLMPFIKANNNRTNSVNSAKQIKKPVTFKWIGIRWNHQRKEQLIILIIILVILSEKLMFLVFNGGIVGNIREFRGYVFIKW